MTKIIKMLPFLGEEELNELAEEILKSENGEVEGLKLHHVAPFLSKSKTDELFLKTVSEGKMNHKLLPFVSDECLDTLTDKIIREEVSLNVDLLYPFLPKESIRKLFKHYQDKRQTKKETA